MSTFTVVVVVADAVKSRGSRRVALIRLAPWIFSPFIGNGITVATSFTDCCKHASLNVLSGYSRGKAVGYTKTTSWMQELYTKGKWERMHYLTQRGKVNTAYNYVEK